MRKKRDVLLLVLLVGALGTVVWLVRSSREPEPAYQGKPLSAWLKDMEHWSGDTNDAAFVAFGQMGTNAIPALLKVIQSGGPPIQKMILKFNRRQSLVHLPFGRPQDQTSAAFMALYAMGTNATPALPVLTDLLLHRNAPIYSAVALAGIGSEAIPVLLTALTNQNHRIRDPTALGLGWARSDFDVVVPALIARLRDGDSNVHFNAVVSLGQLHARPELVVPALMNDFSSPDTLLRRLILSSLGQFGGKAKQSVPMIIGALKDSDGEVRESAGSALEQIDPEAAIKAGVK